MQDCTISRFNQYTETSSTFEEMWIIDLRHGDDRQLLERNPNVYKTQMHYALPFHCGRGCENQLSQATKTGHEGDYQ
ncbi:hypothetical protein O0I10_006293 [Lichtheimia ornata]|uniref:Uncharacterized protein n=1 Tax=Lichtheimia ornata TaxID=688661 RepID=A0AAD7V4J8_9FUNG|nr:uncharacterized protein O0I10_006293 [Lichtheimia ornata]KAJ8658022.1 hypothetical protein O0I10_006293 [Lichtheimia ornata]